MKSLGVLVVVVLAACGGGSGVDCTPQGSCVTATGTGCIESNVAVADQRSVCMQNGGTFNAAPCSKVGVVGGCADMTQSYCATTWYYTAAGVTEAMVRTVCANDNHGTFVSPP